jgi:hypothetical protein
MKIKQTCYSHPLLLGLMLLVWCQNFTQAQNADINVWVLTDEQGIPSLARCKILKDERSEWKGHPAHIYHQNKITALLDSSVEYVRYEYDATYWIKLSVSNISKTSTDWVLSLDNWDEAFTTYENNTSNETIWL